MYSYLKSLKILQICANGCVYFDHSAYLKMYKRYSLSKKSFFFTPLTKKDSTFNNSNFFYKKYRNQSIKKLENEFTINYKKYSNFV